MNERDDQSIDHELGGVAMAAMHEHEHTVSSGETGAALDAVRSRIAGGDLGGAPPSIDLARDRRRRSPLILLGAAAAVVSMIALGLVAVVGGDRTNDVITPGTVAQTDPATTSPVSTSPDTTVAAPEPQPSTTVGSEGFVRQTISVDAANPPPILEPEPYFSLPLVPNPEGGGLISFAVGADHVVVNQPNTGSITIVGPDVDGISAREVPVEEDISSVVSGPGPVVYGFGEPVFDGDDQAIPRGFRFVAIPFLGENAGSVVAVDEVDVNAYLEIPPYFFGHGSDGVITRGRDGATVIGYVDEDGQPRDSGESAENGTSFPMLDLETDLQDTSPASEGIVTLRGTEVSWQLDIERDPTWAPPFVGLNVVAPGAQRAIYTERIGADTDPDADFGPTGMPVVALLNYDGSGEWIRLPDDWDVVASDVWGTLLARITADSIELARLEDLVPPTGPLPPISGVTEPGSPTPSTPAPTPPAPTTAVPTTTAQPTDPGAPGLVQPTAVTRTCVSEFECTQLATTETGRIVALDPGGDTLRVYDETGTEVQSEVTFTEPVGDAPFLTHVGPDDVAYLRVQTPGVQDPSNDLLAIPLVGSDAGSVVMRWTGLDGSGDSRLVPRKSGLTNVNCCGGEGTRPAPDATIYRWVDRNGEVAESTHPSFDLNLGDAGNSLTRIDTAADGSAVFTRFTLPAVYASPRDFPSVVATDDGGALAYDYVQLSSGGFEVIVDFDTDWPSANVDNGDVYYRELSDSFLSLLLEPSGTVVVPSGPNGGEFVRRELDEVATRGWPGEIDVDLESASASAPGLNEYIDTEQPFWAFDRELLALQLSPALSDSAEQLIEVDGQLVIVTTTGLLDDSSDATRLIVTTERSDDGSFRFASATYGFRCVPGRGHQDFSTVPCI
ncbi:MAG: hypothetical protein ABJH68_18635 [Ilumatobacter sp.]|uniref:hypothetical protein n=1 Tax=Ilumatobacter sp. TaxID=1967498 RepID=UPI0032995736